MLTAAERLAFNPWTCARWIRRVMRSLLFRESSLLSTVKRAIAGNQRRSINTVTGHSIFISIVDSLNSSKIYDITVPTQSKTPDAQEIPSIPNALFLISSHCSPNTATAAHYKSSPSYPQHNYLPLPHCPDQDN